MGRDRGETFEFGCTRVRETDGAVCVLDHVTMEEVWFPLSTVHEMHFDGRGDGRIVVDEWIAKEKGLI